MITNFKIFENIDDFPYKKYVVWLQNKGTFDDFFICEIIEKKDKRVLIKGLYWFNNPRKSKNINNSGSQFWVTMEELNSHIKYSSDNLQDCIDVIPELKHTIKYNI